MKREKSCGAVVFREGAKGPEVLLIKHKNGGHWAFPKGHVEKKETEAQKAGEENKAEEEDPFEMVLKLFQDRDKR